MDILTILAGMALFGLGYLIRDFIGVRAAQDAARAAEPDHGFEQLKEIEP